MGSISKVRSRPPRTSWRATEVLPLLLDTTMAEGAAAVGGRGSNTLEPKLFHKLQRAASHGPVVILTASNSACHALVITHDNVLVVPLSSFSFKDSNGLYLTLQVALSSNNIIQRRSAHTTQDNLDLLLLQFCRDDRKVSWPPAAGCSPGYLFQFVLRELWLSVVLPGVQALHLKASLQCLRYDYLLLIFFVRNATRLWWCPTGPFAFLHSRCRYLRWR
jgi:hypothetical protein